MINFYKISFIAIWILFWTFWFIIGSRTKTTKMVESQLSRLTHLLLVILSFSFVGIDLLRFGFLHVKLFAQFKFTNIVGMFITLIGLSFAIYARFYLGINWSGKITIKEVHTIIKSGPYSIVRHPIYSGVLLGLIGTAIAVNEIGGILSIILFSIAYYRKIWIEERMLIEYFGGEYLAYKREVKTIIPFIL